MERTEYATLEPELALASDLAKEAGHAILAVRANAIASPSPKPVVPVIFYRAPAWTRSTAGIVDVST